MRSRYRAIPFFLPAIVIASLILAPITSVSASVVEPENDSLDVLQLPAETFESPEAPEVEVPQSSFEDSAPSAFNVPDGTMAEPGEVLVDPSLDGPAELQQIDTREPLEIEDLKEADIVERGEFDQTYSLDDGSKATRLSVEPMNVQQDDGEWVPIDTAVTTEGPWSWLGIGSGAVPDHPLEPTFAEHANETNVLTLTNDDHTVGFTLEGASASSITRGAISGSDARSHVEYTNVFEDTDLLYDVAPGAVKENIRLNKMPTATTKLSWTWKIDADGLNPSRDATGTISFKDSTGAVVFIIPPTAISDSSGVEGERTEAVEPMRSTLLRVGNSWKLVLNPDMTWLTDPARVYPVMADPTTGVPNQHINAYKSNGTVLTDSVRVGNSNNGGIWRTVLYYDYTQFFGKQILAATIVAGSPGGDSSVDPRWGAVHNATNFQYESLGATLAGLEIGPDGGQTAGLNSSGTALEDPRLSKQISDWVNAGSGGHHLALRGDESPGTFTYKNVDTAMIVEWKDYPNPGIYPIPDNNASRVSITPEIRATGRFDPSGRGIASQVHITTAGGALLWYSDWTSEDRVTVPRNVLQPNTTYRWKQFVRDNFDGWLGTSTSRATGLFTFTTNAAAMPAESTASHEDGATVTSLTPTLKTGSVTSQIGQPVKYMFRVATGQDSLTGTIASSGWLTSPSWKVPSGILQDGGTYRWSVSTKDDVGPYGPIWTNVMRINLRIGTAGPAPIDTVGPVSVNLANGNASVQFSSPVIKTAGGEMGMSFSYNSLKPDNTGLTGTYYDASKQTGAPTWNTAAGMMKQVLVRNDSVADFSWGAASPGPGVPNDKFIVNWRGYIQPPTGKWQFTATADDSYSIKVGTGTNNETNRWSGFPINKKNYGPTFDSLGKAVPFDLKYAENSGNAYITVWAKDVGTPACLENPLAEGCEFIVPSSWFSTTPDTLPAGWSASTAVAGPSGAYASVEVKDLVILLTDSTGTTHAYTKKSAGGYEPPKGEYGVMAIDENGKVNFTDDDGVTFFFNAAGKVEATRNALDVKKQAAPVVTYRGGTGQVDAITDALSSNGRKLTFVYQGDQAVDVGLDPVKDTDGDDSLACRTPEGEGMKDAPADALCRIIYPGHVAGAADTTEIFYNEAGQIARIVDPGAQITSFGYDSLSRINVIRDTLANDWDSYVNTGLKAAATSATTLVYESSKVKSVTLPAPDGLTSTTRPKRTYTYVPDQQVTYVDLDGLDVPASGPTNGNFRKVTYDASFRGTSDTAASGVTTSQVWNEKDMLLSSTDGAGLMTTTIYDAQDRAIDKYGPAKASCFDADRTPTDACLTSVAHTSTAYDLASDGSKLKGLRATYYSNEGTAGTPVGFGLGVGASDGSVNRVWGDGAPSPLGVKTDGWSMQLAGLITFPGEGDYLFEADVDDGMQLWIDNNRLINNRTWDGFHGTPGGSYKAVATQLTVPIRITYMDHTGGSTLRLYYTRPGGTKQLVPGNILSPDYGLVSKSTSHDSASAGPGLSAPPSVTTNIDYGSDPWLGLPRTTTVDPGGLALASKATYETDASDYNRPLTTLTPAGGAAGIPSTTGQAYYESTDTVGGVGAVNASNCGLATTTRQYGMLKTVRTANSNTSVGMQSNVTTSFGYDLFGRQVASKTTGDSATSCTKYDYRGRVVEIVDYGASTTPRIVKNTFTDDGSATGDPRVSTVTETALSTPTQGVSKVRKDLLGRVVSSTDVWNTTTENTYNRLNQLTKTTVKSGTKTFTTEFKYNLDGSVVSVLDGGAVIATPTYDAGGRLWKVNYPSTDGGAGNGTSLEIARDNAGQVSGIVWTMGSSVVTDSVIRSQSGKVIKDTVVDSASHSSTYAFDAAGRMTTARIPGHTLSYEFSDENGCGAASAGLNGNRTKFIDVPTTSQTPTYTTNYCYDADDRLVSASEAATNTVGALASRTRAVKSVADGEVKYDARGNVVKMGDQTFTYDASDRHSGSLAGDGTSVTYKRDAGGAIISRTETVAGTTSEIRYSGSLVLVGSSPVQRSLSLPGGVSLSIPITPDAGADLAAREWTYPNIHGDNTWTASNSGVKTGFYLYDPFGSPMDVSTKIIGSVAANDLVPDNQPGEYDQAWVGSNGKGYEHAGTLAIIEMGVRMYSAWLGRFLAQDPVRGGNTSSYNYPNDPINMFDLSGEIQDCGACSYGRVLGSHTTARGQVSYILAPDPGRPVAYSPSSVRNGSYNVDKAAARVSALNLATVLSRVSAISGLITIGAAGLGAAPVAAAAGGVSMGSGLLATAVFCSNAWGSDDCTSNAIFSGLGIATGGMGNAIRSVKVVGPFAEGWYSGGFKVQLIDSGSTLIDWGGF